MTTSSYTVAAIDFGTTFSGYAYCTKKDLESKTPNIKTNQPWKTGGLDVQFLKTPTTVLFNHNGEFDSFGFEAENKYTKLVIRNKHEEWYYFRRFKMSLHRSLKDDKPRDLNRETEIKDETRNKSMKAMKIFASSIRYLKDHLLSELVDRGSTLAKGGQKASTHDILWILTVPAIWDEAAKQFMREAAVEAGIKSEQLRLALEPEAASFCCQLLQNEHPDCNMSLLPQGTKYTILDLGGGTADITTHEIENSRSLKEIHAPTGGYWGGTKVDVAFEDVIISLVGAPVWLKFKQNYYEDYLDLKREFESVKQTVMFDKDEEQMFKIPSSLVEIFEKTTEEKLSQVITQSSFKDRIEITKSNRMIFQSDTFKDLFNPCIDPLLAKLKELFSRKSMEKVDTILMVGGFSESSFVKGTLRKHFGNKRFIIPDKPSLAIMKGAVIFGHFPDVMSTRVAKFTYGFSAVRKRRPGDPEKHVDDNQCHGIFDKVVEIGTDVPVGNVTAERSYTKVRQQQAQMILMLFSSTNKDPKFVTDPNCSYMGDLTIDIPQYADAEVCVKTVYGDTELVVHAREEKTGKKVTAKFDFLKQ